MTVQDMLALLVRGPASPDDVEAVADVTAALKRLSVRDRSLLVAVAMGYTKAQVAQALRIVHVKDVYKRALGRLRRELDK